MRRAGLTLLATLLGLWGTSWGQVPQTFVSLPQHGHGPRVLHTQTLLNDGRVLLVGGFLRETGLLPPANPAIELFDPRDGSFNVVSQTPTLRAGHTATLLGDGRVVLIGGSMLPVVEIYDPRTEKLVAKGSLVKSRAEHQATLLHDGRVLVTGGVTGYLAYRAGAFHRKLREMQEAELYDPVTGHSVVVGPMTVARRGHTATLLNDGTVLLAGGTWDRRCERFDPRTGRFRLTGPLNTEREDHRATTLPDGTLLVTGGTDSRNMSLASAEVYDPVKETFETLPAHMKVKREDHTADVLSDGNILFTGGEDNQAGPGREDVVLQSSEIFDPVLSVFIRVRDMTSPRDDHRATMLPDGRVFLYGGTNRNHEALDTGEMFIP